MNEIGLSENSQYLTFVLDEELFAIDIAQVVEVLEYNKITKVPRTPAFMLGVINLRGSVIPVVNMRLKFAMKQVERTVDTSIIIAEVELDGERTVLGAMVDCVQEVFDLDASNIEPPPKIGARLNTAFIKGMGKRGDEFIIILDIEKVFSTEELSIVQQASQGVGNIQLDAEQEDSEEDDQAAAG